MFRVICHIECRNVDDILIRFSIVEYCSNGKNKIVGLGYGANKVSLQMSNIPSVPPPNQQFKFSEKEDSIRIKATQNKIGRAFKSNVAALLIFLNYLVNMESVLSCLMTVGLTLYWYFYAMRLGIDPEWSGSGIDWVVLGFGKFPTNSCYHHLHLHARSSTSHLFFM